MFVRAFSEVTENIRGLKFSGSQKHFGNVREPAGFKKLC